jgi:hypothetical protein
MAGCLNLRGIASQASSDGAVLTSALTNCAVAKFVVPSPLSFVEGCMIWFFQLWWVLSL